jgi:5-methylcytosine-specific restriction endonuclease McrA
MVNQRKLSEIKRCGKCRRFKPADMFSRSARCKDGLQGECKPCAAERSKKWREENPEKWRASRRGWKAANPDKVRAIHRNTSHKRYYQKKGCGLGAAGLLAWESAQLKVCHWCGVRCARNYHVDHIIPLAKGGAHELTNLCIACPSCNLSKAAKDPIEFAQSLGMLI